MRFCLLVVRAFTLVLALLAVSRALASSDDQNNIVEFANVASTEDLDGITKRGFLRIFTIHNPLFFSFDGEKQKGMVAELGKMFEDHLDKYNA